MTRPTNQETTVTTAHPTITDSTPAADEVQRALAAVAEDLDRRADVIAIELVGTGDYMDRMRLRSRLAGLADARDVVRTIARNY